MLSTTNFFNFYGETMKMNSFIRLCGKELGLFIPKMRNLYIICFVYFLKIKSTSSIDYHDTIPGIDAVEISLKKHDNKVIKGDGEIIDLDLAVRLWICPFKACRIKRLKYNGLELTLKYEDRRYPHHLNTIDRNDDGTLEMKDETGKIVSYDQVYVVGIRFKAIIEFSGGRFVDTYIKFTSPYGQVKYSDIIKNDEFEYNFEFNGIIHTEALMGETTIEDLNDNTIRIRPTDTDTTFDMVDFNKTPIYIKISNFYKKGYVYYEDSTGKERKAPEYKIRTIERLTRNIKYVLLED